MKSLTYTIVFVIACAFLFASSLQAHGAERVGIVLMHGKKGTVEQMQPLADTLVANGYLVETPELPWSRARAYDRPLAQAHQEIDTAVEFLRRRGAMRVVIAGHSMGANMAITYAATHKGVDAVMALGPGQTVESESFAEKLGASIESAKRLSASGDGDKAVKLLDLQLGKVSSVEVTPNIYLSYFDPDGLANMPKTIREVNVPLLWTVGNLDKNMFDRGAAYAFELAPRNALNRYEVVEADHMATPEASRAIASQWLKAVFPIK